MTITVQSAAAPHFRQRRPKPRRLHRPHRIRHHKTPFRHDQFTATL